MKTLIKVLILPVIGLVLIAVPTVLMVQALTEPDLAQFGTPGSATFQVEEPGEFTVWRYYVGITSENEFQSRPRDLPAGLSIQVVDQSDSSTVPLSASLNTTMQSGSSYKTSLFGMQLTPGTYKIVASSESEPIEVIVTRDKASFKGFLLVLLCYTLGGIFLLVGLVYGFVVLIKYLLNRPSPPPPTTAP